jgi:uncharacterized protein
LKAELSASEARRAALTAQLCKGVDRLGLLQIDSVNILVRAQYLLAGLAMAPVAGIDRLFATLHVGPHPAFAELAPAQSERACYG